jgi:ABC-type nitrate/sulfonate/bicarbonate transport system ATPase subunit
VEAVYLGDRVWLFTKNPGKIGCEFRELPKPVPGISPQEAQKSPPFLAAVESVAGAFRKIEQNQMG